MLRSNGGVMMKWRNGGLPRNAWGDGWWEHRGDGAHEWKRVNVTERPLWSYYPRASREIKVSESEDKECLPGY